MGKETMQQLPGEESVTTGSGKSAMKEEVVSPETEESVTEAVKKEGVALVMGKETFQHAEELMPDFYSSMPPENREKLMKHNKERAEKMKDFMLSLEDLARKSGKQDQAENYEFGKWRTRPERQLYAEIQRALLDIQEKLTKKRTSKMDKETLRMLNDVSNMLDDEGADDDDGKDTNEDTNTAMVQDGLGHDDRGKSSATPFAEEMTDEAERFASYRRLWEYKWSKTCGFFKDSTVLSSMQFTHYTPGRTTYSSDCTTTETLQIISIKLTQLAAGGLELPLSVYGVVAVRDMVDRNRNVLFFRDRSEAQELKQNDPFLHLIGPSRAIVFTEKVCIEIELRVVSGSQDRALISCVHRYAGGNGPGVSSICFKNVLCTLELCLEPVKESVQATILGVQVAKDDGWPFKYGGLVACSPLSGTFVVTDSGITRNIDPSSIQIVLIESTDEAMPKGKSGYVDLWRQVVSVKLQGRLDFVIRAYSESGAIAAETLVPFYPKVCNISRKKCYLGDAQVTITVAWSVVAASKTGLSFELSGVRSTV